MGNHREYTAHDFPLVAVSNNSCAGVTAQALDACHTEGLLNTRQKNGSFLYFWTSIQSDGFGVN